MREGLSARAAPTTSASSSELYIAATDLDTCEPLVFGDEGWDDVPIASAVRASTALPMVYAPHQVRDRELVDGGLVSTTNVDIAVEASAKFVIIVNPLVPFVNDFPGAPDAVRRAPAADQRHGLPDDRVPDVQAARLPAPARARRAGRTLPGVDIVLIEPEPDDELMFPTNILN